MITARRAEDRGRTELDWLDARHTFSFGDYHDPEYGQFRTLRVINEDRVRPASGFGTHPHRDMEIITVVLDGELEHEDSMGNGSIIRPGDVQRMTAGIGVTHSEFNPSDEHVVHLLQIWILPERRGLAPGYEQKHLPPRPGAGWRLIGSRDGRDDSVTVHQDAEVYRATPAAGEELEHVLAPGRGGWLHVARGEVGLGDLVLTSGDGAAILDVKVVRVEVQRDADLLLFDLG